MAGLPAAAQTGAAAGAGIAAAPRLDFNSDEMALARAVASNPDLAAFYGSNGLHRVFSGDAGQALSGALVQAVGDAPRHAIPVSRYGLGPASPTDSLQDEVQRGKAMALYLRDMTGGMLRPLSVDPLIVRTVDRPDIPMLMARIAASPDPLTALRDVQPHSPDYVALQRALSGDERFAVAADIARAPEGLWKTGMRDPAITALRARLDDIGFTAPAAEPDLFDQPLATAVAAYQQAVGLKADGVAGPNTVRRLNGDPQAQDGHGRSIAVALERLRWMGGQDLSQRHVWVNIPEFTARIVDQGQQVFSTRVVVGKDNETHQTPEFSDQMEYLVVNPRWNVPRSITVKEYLPKLKANRNAVSHLDIVDGRGNVIARDQIDFGRYTAANFPYRMRQKPSDDNALGLVKFIFPNQWNIYLHDTPTKHLFGNSMRAYSHGCVRVGDPFDLATTLLSPQTDDPRGMFQRALDSGRETWLALKPNPPVHLVYFTAYPDASGQIRYFGDIYGRDAKVWAALQRAGLENRVAMD